MVISHKYKYLFIATPRTGSTAIQTELIKNYEGETIYRKHSHYFEFLSNATIKEKDYFVFASIRNPLDDIVSIYMKLKSNHGGYYSNSEYFSENGGFVTRGMRRK